MKKALMTLTLLAATSAQAQLTSNVGVTSDYRFRGMSQTQNGLALQGGVDYAHKSGIYAGNWNSTVSNRVYGDSTGLEMDFYAGYKTQLVPGLKLDLGSYNYVYSQAANKFGSNSNTNEVYVGLESGLISVRYNRSISDYFGLANSKGTQYLQANANVPLNKVLNLDAHVGRTLVHGHSNRDHTDVKLGGTLNVQGFLFGAHYHTNLQQGGQVKALNTVDGQQLYKNALVVSVSRLF